MQPRMGYNPSAMVTMDSIREFSRRLATEFHPERIVLFGSYASGTPTSDSDVDLLVVMPFEGKPVNQSVEMRVRLRPKFAVDLIVRTPQAVQQRLEMGDPFMRDVLRDGKVLYEAEPTWELSRVDSAYLSDFAVAFRYPGEAADKESALDAHRRCRAFRSVARTAFKLPL